MEQALLKVDGISKSFPGVKALSEVSFDINQGEVHALVGENGAGKSTLMNILSGVYQQDCGSISFCGTALTIRDPREAQHMGIAMIHQELSLATHLSVMENIYIGRLIKNKFGLIDYAAMRRECASQLQRVGLEGALADALVSKLSVSQMQMVEIAKALSLKAKLIIMDEPSSSLTKRETEVLFSIIRKLQADGVSIVYISHRMDEVFTISDRITVLRDGKGIKTLVTKETNTQEVLSLMVGRKFERATARTVFKPAQDAIPALDVRNLSYSDRVKDVSFKLFPGEVVSVTGLVGAGRTELAETIFGLRKKSSGQVFINGKQENCCSVSKAIELGLGLVPEGRKVQGILQGMTVQENITITSLKKFCKSIFVNAEKEKQSAEVYVEKLRVKTPNLGQKIQYLSGGNQQKAILARWLLNNPKVLMLDEPTHGIDVGAKGEIYELIHQLASEGMAILIISSELPEVLTLSDRVLVMHNGKMTGELVNKELTQETIMKYATNQLC